MSMIIIINKTTKQHLNYKNSKSLITTPSTCIFKFIAELKRSPIGIMGKKRKPMKDFPYGYHG